MLRRVYSTLMFFTFLDFFDFFPSFVFVFFFFLVEIFNTHFYCYFSSPFNIFTFWIFSSFLLLIYFPFCPSRERILFHRFTLLNFYCSIPSTFSYDCCCCCCSTLRNIVSATREPLHANSPISHILPTTSALLPDIHFHLKFPFSVPCFHYSWAHHPT